MGRLRQEGSTCARRKGREDTRTTWAPAPRACGGHRETGPTLEFERCLPYLSGLSGRQHVLWVTVPVQNGPRGTRLTALLRGSRRKTRGVAAFPSLLRCRPPRPKFLISPEGRIQAFPENHLDRESVYLLRCPSSFSPGPNAFSSCPLPLFFPLAR